MTAWRVGIDIGGTFTDAALVDAETGQVRVVKVLTTPEDPAQGFMSALERGLGECGAGGRDVAAVVHATTVATNAIIEGKTARVGMLVTRGFRDILEIGRQIRSRLYDVHLQKPVPLVPRRWSLEVSERLDADGHVLEALDVSEVRAAVRQLRAERVEAVVICFLHAYLNPAHERAAAAIVREEMPEAWLSVSSEVCPEFREYLRGSTAAVNAAVMPIVSRYVDALESRLAALGATAPFYVMQSNGGVMTSASAKERPVYMVESGPAAGVIAAGAVAAPYRYANVLSFDMGGTTAKVGLIQDGRLRLSTEMEVGAQAVTPLGEGRGGGYPVRTPVIDLVEVGAGGGSEAWIDAGGALRVGPRSAGARPGPACYGRGGVIPTITDANVALGRLDPSFFLGGEMTLDAGAARRAIADRVATPLGLDPIAAASGIVEIANAHMIAAMRLVSVQRGYDPRDFVLVAFGGAGPVHANALARDLGIPTVLVPPSPGIASAVGMLATDIRHEFVATRRLRLDGLAPATLEALFAEFLAEGEARLVRDGVPLAERRMVRSADLRYHGQSFELPVTVPPGPLAPADVARLRDEFHAMHERAYGYAAPEDAVELVNVRLAAIGVTPKPRRAPLPEGGPSADAARKGRREIWFAETAGFRSTVVLDRGKLLRGNVIAGPAIIEEHDASTLVHPGWTATVDEHANLVLRPG
ncbi:MAG TPA: hydantoinase/oxoprolinase family protein [Candidatus Bathyarchaeia archaeon]|nr:hydantoinase/oxoprolinase family protein [Candidatus Bathyarchaeia archaeon]